MSMALKKGTRKLRKSLQFIRRPDILNGTGKRHTKATSKMFLSVVVVVVVVVVGVFPLEVFYYIIRDVYCYLLNFRVW